MEKLVWFIITWTSVLLGSVRSHGRLERPPCRASMWRYGYDTPPDYDDNQLFCGGLTRQMILGGRCGICGDPYDSPVPRQHEMGGPFYKAYLVANYSSGSVINVQVRLTANHKGFFQFKICPVRGFNTEATQECLDGHVLRLEGSFLTQYPIRPDYAEVRVRLHLPDGLTCEHCVFQWRYHAGNSWGRCPDGTQATGCGPQEEFYGCADVAIHDGGRTSAPRPTSAPITSTRRPWRSTRRPSDDTVCMAVAPWNRSPGMDAWCQVNCHFSPAFCPASHCRCRNEAEAARTGKQVSRP